MVVGRRALTRGHFRLILEHLSCTVLMRGRDFQLHRRHSSGRSNSIEELRNAFELAERSSPGITDSFVSEIIQRLQPSMPDSRVRATVDRLTGAPPQRRGV